MTTSIVRAAHALASLTALTLTGTAFAANVPQPYVEFNARAYHVEKVTTGDAEAHFYFDGERWYTAQELRAHVAAEPPVVLTPAVWDAIAGQAPETVVDVAIVLRPQPTPVLARAARERAQDELDALSTEIRAVTRAALPTQSLSPAQERVYQPAPLAPQLVAARRALAEQRDALEQNMRAALADEAESAVRPAQDELSAYIGRLGGEVYARTSVVSTLGAWVPAGRLPELAAHPLVANIDLNYPGEPELDNQRHSLGLVTGFWANGIDGGVQDVGVLDTGVQQSHPALNSHTFLSNMGANDTDIHGTGMAGILASTDATFQGVAHGCDKICVALAGSITTSMPGMNYIAGTGEPENVNYSFGNGTATGTDYINVDQFFDGVIDTFGFMVSKSTGNGGFGSGSTTITRPAPAYNLLASANMDDMNTVTRTDDRITSSSSRGPTAGGRKKPDITAPGNNTMSCTPSGSFSNIGGTSSASPHTGGGFVLLWDMGNTSTMGAKAVLLNTTDALEDNGTSSTADDVYVAGSLWNRRYGWGYLNLGQAYLHGLDVFLGSVPAAPETADYKLYRGEMFASERATLVWQRHVAYNGATYPTQIESLSDLDLFCFRETDNALLSSSVSTIDNVEQLDVDSDATVVLKVEAAGTFDPDIPTESFALATQENFVAATGPFLAGSFALPPTVVPGQTFVLTFNADNDGDLAAHAVQAQLSGIAIVTGPNPAPVGAIAAGSSAVVTWTVQAPATAGSYPLSVALSSTSYGESFTGTGIGTLVVSAPAGCTGDMNCDGSVTFKDVDPFVKALSGQAAYEAAYPGCIWLNGDIDGDLNVTFKDINPFVGVLGTVCAE